MRWFFGLFPRRTLGPTTRKPAAIRWTVSLFDRFVRQKISCDLLEEESIERNVRADRVDHPVAVPPRFTKEEILVESVRIGVAGEIEPMSPPTLAKVGRVEQRIDETRHGVRTRVRNEIGDLSRSRRKTDELKVESPNERPPVGIGNGPKSGGFESGEHEVVDRIPRPREVAHGGKRRGLECPERPMVSPSDRVGRSWSRGGLRPRGAFVRPKRRRRHDLGEEAAAHHRARDLDREAGRWDSRHREESWAGFLPAGQDTR